MAISHGFSGDPFSAALSFRQKCADVLAHQLRHNAVYRAFYIALLGHSEPVANPPDIPLLPIRAFRHKHIIASSTEKSTSSLVFRSSGTTGTRQSTHTVAKPEIYRKSIEKEFYRHFPKREYSIIAHMPGYSQNPNSSLIYMMNHLIGNDSLSSFMEAFDSSTIKKIEKITAANKKWILFSAAFGLLDLIDHGLPALPSKPEIIETGGMKTRRREISKSELRKRISESFAISPENIHSEYGMCELLSQMYSIGGEWFTAPKWVQVTIRKPENPMQLCEPGQEGKIGIIDLANVYSCPFILTEDKGVMREDGAFRVLGRWNSNNLRGCNFLIDRD